MLSLNWFAPRQRRSRLLRLFLRILGILRHQRDFDSSRAARNVPPCCSFHPRRAKTRAADLLLGNHISVILAFASGITPHTSGMSLLLGIRTSSGAFPECPLPLHVGLPRFYVPDIGRSFPQSHLWSDIRIWRDCGQSDLVQFFDHWRITEPGKCHRIWSTKCLILRAFALWAGYFLQPEPARRLVTMPVTSPLMRWNDVAQTLGNPAGQVAVSYPPSFMTDVFDLVENVMGPTGVPQRVTAASRPGPIAS